MDAATSADSETVQEFFERRTRELAADIGAEVTFHHDGNLVAELTCKAVSHWIAIEPRLQRSADARTRINGHLRNMTDSLYAYANTPIPDGAVYMMLRERRIHGGEDEQPIVMIDRGRRAFRRFGDGNDRPWPPIVFYTSGRQGFVEHETA